MDLQAPQGDTGFNGSVGFTGSQGDQGVIGFTGSQGNVGFNGSTGFTGSQGDIGYTGSQGDIGFTGSQGFTGSSVVAGTYTFTQSVAAATWTVNHNLDTQYVNIEVIDSSGNSLVGTYSYPTISFTNGNTATLYFETATAGICGCYKWWRTTR